jgi:regulatory protein
MGTYKQPKSRSKEPKTDTKDALIKIFRYCAYQERTHHEVKNKLFEYGLPSTEVDEILSYLIVEGFLNEERYAKAFAGGKFRILKWGKLKIQKELESSGVSFRNIKIGIAEITATEYSKTLLSLIKKKSGMVKDENIFKRKNKIARFVIAKGYEPELVWEVVNELLAS